MTAMKHNPMKQALDFLETVIRERDKFPEQFIAIPRNSPLLTKIFSPEPNRIMDYLEEHNQAKSVQKLANALRRDKAAVSRDVKLLQSIGLVTATRLGKEKMLEPSHRTVLVH